jgi:hypothetical protein
MSRGFEVSGGGTELLFYALQLGVLLVLLALTLSFDGLAGLVFAGLVGALAAATGIGLWRKATGQDEATHLGTPEDITHDRFGDPGQTAKDRWQRAVDRLPDDED